MTAGPVVVDATRIVAGAFLVAMMLAMGLELGGEPRADKAARRDARRLLARALAFELVLLPLVALTLTHAWRAGDDVALALLLLAACPGGRFAPQLARLARADLGLAVETTLFLAKLVAFTAPVTARLLLHTHHLELHELPFIVQLLLVQLAPYLVGRALRRRRPALAAKLARPVGLATWALLAILAVVVLARLPTLAPLAGARGWWPVVIFAVVAPALGWLVGGPAAATRRAFAVVADARNVALAALLASLALPPGRAVHAAVLGVWLALLVADGVFVSLTRIRIHPATATGGVQ